jgi:hypothetical protein
LKDDEGSHSAPEVRIPSSPRILAAAATIGCHDWPPHAY